MGKKTDLHACRSGSDFLHYSNHHGGQVVRQSGSHAIVRGPHGGICPIPIHPGDLANGTRHAIVKALAIILGVISLATLLAPTLVLEIAQAIW